MNLAEFIIKIESFNANVNIPLVRKAYEFSDHAHAGQKRVSGEPYVEHCLQVAFILAEQHMDSTSLAAGLIHDVVEDTDITLEEIRREFGDEVADLVDGVTKIGSVRYKSREERQAEYFRKMLLTMAKDIRVILIKLADRLHNMRSLDPLPSEKRLRIARETSDVYCPLAHRFGINKIKTELEDLSLKYLEPDVYSKLVQNVRETKTDRENYIVKVVKPLKKALSESGINATIYGRAKHLDSIYRKIKVRGVPFEDIYDLFAIRCIVRTVRECYHTLGTIHSMWKPIENRFHDYIANPKPNGYRSLHTTVFGPDNCRVEIQIRTHQMHHIAENGIAAHWLYKEGRQEMSKSDRQMAWLRDVLEWQKDMTSPSDFLEYLKIDLYSEDIFVYTPDGELIHLPRGATPLDFAFQIHSEIGIHCAGAKINNRLQPLSTELNTGDMVKIITSQKRMPSHDWLRLVKTSNARSRIRRWLKQVGFDQSIELGREILQRKLRALRLTIPSTEIMQGYAEQLNKKTVEDLMGAIGNGDISAQKVVSLIQPDKQKKDIGLVNKVIGQLRGSKGIKIQGLDNMMFRFAGCCQPIPGEDVIGFITRGRGVTVHRSDCAVALDLQSRFPERKVEVSWDTESDQSFVVRLKIVIEDRKNMLRDVMDAIADSDTNVRAAEIYSSDTTAVGEFVIEVSSLSHLNRVLGKVRRVKGVISLVRTHGREKSNSTTRKN
ncbi:MAG: bifunctional (p)ppGpp synthetase/guanosine-3',5'-bis(diphosphate) 3'-pyrophosphohydrolase [candidate division Zixibacteria bacterium]|nr:bifunctional (p)ppGpp synthetase/guanosine-3',5'-bis(diphosphate) 3'-pyrophosphohydrolase [candidate division Zixibacteria bacterium]